ncbi:MAG: TonB-dependent receptor, partial [Pseudomonadales bacterium]
AFNNDVTLDRWTPFSYGHLQGLPDYVEPGGWALRDREERNIRVGGGIEMTIPDTTWETELSFTWGERQKAYASAWGSTYNSSFGNVFGRINCVRNDNEETPRGVNADCVPFNPFSTSQFPIVNYEPQYEVTPELIEDPNNPGEMIPNPAFNTAEMVEGVMTENKDLETNNVTLVDFVIAGAPYELPWSWSGGSIGVAVGAQLRIEEEEFLPNHINESNTNIYGTGFPRRDSEEKALDGFAEMVLPVMQHSTFGYLELQVAGRHTHVEYKANIGNTDVAPGFSKFVPKYAALYQPNDWLSFRASYSEGFVTPAQSSVVGTQRDADRTTRDPTCRVLENNYGIVLDAANGFPGSGCTYEAGGQTLGEELIDVVGANPDLGPQTSEATSFGVSFRLLDGDLDVDLNYIDIEFLDEIRTILIRDRIPIEQSAFNDGLIGECGSTPSATCAAAYRQTYITTLETDRFVREGDFGPIRRHLGGPENTTGRFVTAYDFQTRYRFRADQIPVIGGNWGAFQASLNGTYNEHYQYHIGPDSPVREGAGHRNDCCSRQPIPRWRINGALRYMYGDHTARLSFTWHDDVKDLSATGAIPFSNKDGKIDSQALFNLYYQYRLDLFNKNLPTRLSVSVNNLFDDRPKPLTDSSGIDPILSGTSALGRIVALRLEQEF